MVDLACEEGFVHVGLFHVPHHRCGCFILSEPTFSLCFPFLTHSCGLTWPAAKHHTVAHFLPPPTHTRTNPPQWDGEESQKKKVTLVS